MKPLLNISIPGNPVGLGRPRVELRQARPRCGKCGRGKPYPHIHPAKTSETWTKMASKIMRVSYGFFATPAEGPLTLFVWAVKKRPVDRYRKKDPEGRFPRTTTPDGDNVLKIVADALKKAGVIADDKFIVEWYAKSLYAAKDEDPCVEVRLERYHGEVLE